MTGIMYYTKWRIWLMRLFAMVFVPLLILGGTELVLRLAGYGYDTNFFSRVRIDGRDFYVPNENFGRRFFPPAITRTIPAFRFAAIKSTNTYRVFLFGESAALGDPDSSYGMGRYLQVLLNERYPGIHFEVICVAITAVDSNVILPIARDCVRHQGDLWVIYMGNNEMVGPFGAIKMVPFASNFSNGNSAPPPFGAETAYGLQAPPLWIIRTVVAVKATRIGQLMHNIIRDVRGSSAGPKQWGGMGMFMNGRIGYDDPARLRATANFRGNLEDILRIARRAGVPVILSTVAVNLKDCGPFASIHKSGLSTNQLAQWNEFFQQGVTNEANGLYKSALASFRKAAEIDPQYAELQFRMGNCDLALTNSADAQEAFKLARDYDALDFRADSRINSVIRDEAARHADSGVHLVDAAKILAQDSPDGIPGLNFFYEHVHLNFAGNYLLALNFADKVKELLPRSITARDKGSWATEELCERRLAVTVWDRQRVWQPIFDRITAPPFTGQFDHAVFLKTCEAKWNQAKALMKTQTPEQARQMYEQALAIAPDDFHLHVNFEGFLETGGNLIQAIAEAKRCCELIPQPKAYYYTGTLLVRDDKINEATNYFLHALAIQGDYAQAETAMGEVLANQQKVSSAMHWFDRAIRSDPHYTQIYLARGFFEQSHGKMAAAMADYQRAANLEPDGPADYFNRANVAAASYQWDEAIADLQAVVKAEPELWQAHYVLGIDLAAAGKEGEADRELSAAIHFRPDFAPAHLYLGITLAAQKETAQALLEFRTVLKLDPANASARQEIEHLDFPDK